MRLGIAYNFFNGEEHLAASLRSVRASAHYICVVQQGISNIGEEMPEAARAALADAVAEGLVDRVLSFTPDLSRPRHQNELAKRVIGLKACRRARCTHYLGMDADEFYRARELETAKQIIAEERLTQTTVKSFFHLKRPVYRALDSTNVAFITRITPFTRLGARSYPVPMVDPTRTTSVWPARHRFFQEDVVAMYHMNFVRRDFGSKFRNTSTTDTAFLERVANAISGWSYPEPFEFPNKGRFDLSRVENEFAVFDPEEETLHDA